MSRRNLGLVYRKELRDLLRDRRTLISMIVVPVVVMPLLMTGLGMTAVKLGGKVRKEVPKVMVLGDENSPTTMAALRALKSFDFVPPSQDFTNLISDKKINAAVGIPKDFDAVVRAGDTATVAVYTYEGEFKSMLAAQSLEQFFRSRRDHIVAQRLAEHQLPEKLLTPFEIRENQRRLAAKSERQRHRHDSALHRHRHVHDGRDSSLDRFDRGRKGAGHDGNAVVQPGGAHPSGFGQGTGGADRLAGHRLSVVGFQRRGAGVAQESAGQRGQRQPVAADH